jgi:hypothetical protein
MWTISPEIPEEVLLVKLNVEESLSPLTQIRIMTDQPLVRDLKPLDLDRVLVRLLNHHPEIK